MIDEMVDMSLNPRTEQDALGAVRVPGDRLWGAQTQRCLDHFKIGYDKAAQIARTAHAERTTLKQAAVKLGFVSADEFDRLVDLQALRKPFPPKR